MFNQKKSKLMQTKGQLMKSLHTAFSFAPPSILSLTILSPHTNYFVNNRRQDRGKSRLHLECICPFLWTAHRFLPIEPNRCATALAGHRAAIWFNWNLSYNNLYMHKKQYIYENTLNPKFTQFIFSLHKMFSYISLPHQVFPLSKLQNH